jgi:hypothetical protein
VTALESVSGARFDLGSFRDRSGRVFEFDGRIYRALSATAIQEWNALAEKPFLKNALANGTIVRTTPSEPNDSLKSIAQAAGFSAVLAHERMPLISWPYEWSFSMLRDAALLTLELMTEALADGAILKDATPFNIQFRGAAPVLIDTGSIVSLEPGRPWEGYRQFCQQFLYPLMLQAWKGIDFQSFLRGSLDGITPENFVRLLSLRDLLRRGALAHGWLHARLQRRTSAGPQIAQSLQDSGFGKSMIQSNVRGLTRIVEGLSWKAAASTWSDYDHSSEPVQRDSAAKEQFIAGVCASGHWKTVWDLGCNQGRYSRIAAEQAELVVAVDSDHLTVDRLYRALQNEQNRKIVTLVMNLADPSPSQGWRGTERLSLERRSKPDLVFCLALIHHLVIGSNLLLPDVVEWLASLNAAIVIEFVDRTDAQVRCLLANRRDVFTDYSAEHFQNLLGRHFTITREQALPSGTRTLYFLQPLTAISGS